MARWIRDIATSENQPERALDAAMIAMRERPGLEDYQIIQSLAGDRWPELREELLSHLRQLNSLYSLPKVDIFLHEGLIDDAIDSLGDYVGYSTIEKVAEAAVSARPDWVIQVSRKQAEVIMNAGKSNAYHHAAKWLKKARAAYLAADREEEWREYLADLLDQHRRKRALVPRLKEML